jgi:flagella basal body P-ring formation protein FlgA
MLIPPGLSSWRLPRSSISKRRVWALGFAASVLLPAALARADDIATMFPVLAITVPAGGIITENMIAERRLIANEVALKNYHTSRDGLIGKVAKRAIQAGAAIPMTAVREQQVFVAGDRVTIEFASGGVIVRGVGIALQPGTANQPARVRNIDSGIVVDGMVRRDGVVEVGGG